VTDRQADLSQCYTDKKGGDASFYTCGCNVECVSAGLKVNLTLQAASGNYIYRSTDITIVIKLCYTEYTTLQICTFNLKRMNECWVLVHLHLKIYT